MLDCPTPHAVPHPPLPSDAVGTSCTLGYAGTFVSSTGLTQCAAWPGIAILELQAYGIPANLTVIGKPVAVRRGRGAGGALRR